MPFSRHEYQEVFDLALKTFWDELVANNRPEVVARIRGEVTGKRDTITFTMIMKRMVKIMDLCQDVIGQQSDHPARHFPALNRKRRQ